MTARLRRLALGGAWLAITAIIALGSAGIVAGIDHRPADGGRPELTWVADRILAPALAAGLADLEQLTMDVDALGADGRAALAALTARDSERLELAISEGALIVGRVRERSTALRTTLRSLPYVDGPDAAWRVGPDERARHAALLAALDATDGLDAAWGRLANSGLTAIRLTDLLERHDAHVVAATAAGRREAYEEALPELDAADAALTAAMELRDRLRNTIDVTTLDEWLSRNEAYDAALRRLYVAFRDARGRVTDEVRAAVREELSARERLPPDTRGLVIIMAEIGRGGANQSVIAVEQARGRLGAAVELLREDGLAAE